MPNGLTLLLLATLAAPQPAKPRARDLGVPFETNTHSVGTVRDASIAWGLKHGARLQPWRS
jgi:hypothetical protein